MDNLLLTVVILLLVLQIYALYRFYKLVRHTGRLLSEIRLILKRSGLYYERIRDKVITRKTCEFCKYRSSFISIDGDSSENDFYYRCQRKNIEISLGDSCEYFLREFRNP